MPSGIGTAGGRRPARVRLPGRPALRPQAGPHVRGGHDGQERHRPESDPVFSEVQLLPATLKSFRRGYPHRTGHHLLAAGRPGPRLHPGAGRPGRRRAHPGRHEPGRLGPRHRPQPGVFTETFADSDQLACIACGQQWRSTSLRGQWWQCPNRCNQSAAYQRTGHLPVTDRVDRATTPGRLPLAPGRGRDQAGGSSFPGRSPARLVTEGVRTLWHLSRQERRYGLSAVTSADGCAPGRSKVETSW